MLGKLIKDLLRGTRSRRLPHSPLTPRDTDRLKTALALEKAGRAADAERIYRELLLDHPDHVDLLHLLGNALKMQGSYAEAIEYLQRAAALAAGSAELHCHLADALAANGELAPAVESYKRALEVDPALAPASICLGHALRKLGELAAAAAAFRRAIELLPGRADVYVALAGVLRDLGQCDEALAACTRAIEIQPDFADAHVNMGHTLRELGRSAPSIAAYRRAAALCPEVPEVHLHLGNALFVDGYSSEEAERELRWALELRPEFNEARFNLALIRLARGDYVRGWPDYELRLRSPDWPRRAQEFPQWTGGMLGGKKLLVYAEQGLGDEIMFASCIPDLAATGAQCVVECTAKLETLFRRSFPHASIFAIRPDRSVPAGVQTAGIELQSPIGSLPLYLRRTREDFPPHRGYLKADPRLTADWQARLAALGPGLKVGISWQGGTQKSRRLVRSLPLAQWLPILQTAHVHFVDLQYTDCSAEIAALQSASGALVHSFGEIRTDYEQAAALVASLDLVISVCTAVIHLGGALGRPVWVMVPYGCEWRYGIAGEEMPWYPSVRLFRQAAFGAWEEVAVKVAGCLREAAHVPRAGLA